MNLEFSTGFSYSSVAYSSSSGGSSFPTECWALDLNNDGRDDFVSFTPWTEERLRPINILLSSEEGFVEAQWNTNPLNSMVLPRNMSSGDFNGDGLLDMAFFMAGNNEVSDNQSEPNQIYINNGDGSFEVFFHEYVYHGGQGSSHGGAVADIDGDGDIDIIPTQYGPPFYWLENTTEEGAFSFVERTDNFLALTELSYRDEISNFQFADLDNDGIQDFLIGWGSWSYMDERPELNLFFGSTETDYLYGETDAVSFYSGLEYVGEDSDTLFSIHGVRVYGQTTPVIELFDYDKDGDLDIFAASNIMPMDTPEGEGWDGLQIEGYELFLWRNSFINVYENLGNREFRDSTAEVIPNQDAITSLTHQAGYPKDLYFADFNSDGAMDILLRAEGGSEWSNWSAPEDLAYPFIWLRDGDSFVPISKEEARPLWGEAAEQLVAGDFNGDGAVDILGRTVLDPDYGRDENGAALGQPSEYSFVTYLNQGGSADLQGATRVQGTQLDNLLVGTGGADMIIPGLGNDEVFGGEAIDSVFYWDERESYTLRWDAELGGLRVAFLGGEDRLFDVERLHFADSSVALDAEDSNSAGGIYRTYQAAFSRTPDKSGFGYWLAQADAGMSAVEIAERFTWSDEFLQTYSIDTPDHYLAGSDIEAVVDGFYQNVLGRNPDVGGLEYYTEVISDEEKTVGRVLAEIADSPENRTSLQASIQSGMEYDLWTV